MKAFFRPAAFLATALLIAGCGDSGTEPEPEQFTLAGSYQLLAMTQAGQTGSPPFIVGTLTLTSARYTLDVEVLVPGQEQHLIDEGTYSTNGTAWSQVSEVIGGQGTGTWTLVGTTLTLDLDTDTQGHITMVWAAMQ